MAILGDMGEPALARLGCIAGKRLAIEENLSAWLRPYACDRLEQLALAISRDTGNADDLTCPDAERDIVHTHDAFGVLDGKVPHFKHGAFGPAFSLVDPQEHSAPDHQLGE